MPDTLTMAAGSEVIRLGGNTDTTAAIVGGLVGAGTGPSGVPLPWLNSIAEWPRSVRWMRALASALAQRRPAPNYCRLGVVPRNAVFAIGVYWLLLRRILPPW